MNWFNKIVAGLSSANYTEKATDIPKGLWLQCKGCETVLYVPDLENRLHVCPHCDFHLRLNAKQRIDFFLDKENREQLATNVEATDWLRFRDMRKYKDRLSEAKSQTQNNEAALAYMGEVLGTKLVTVAFDFTFMGGSMGSGVGEIFYQAANRSLQENIPFVCFATSGGARMQEGLTSLFQMGKTSSIIARLNQHAIPYISVLTDPTYGGVTASFAMLGDINIAEPKAMIGFAGRRVIEQTVRQTLPESFQTSEFLLEHGALDMIVRREHMRETIHATLSHLTQK